MRDREQFEVHLYHHCNLAPLPVSLQTSGLHRPNMTLIALAAWLLFFNHGLALDSSLSLASYTGHGLESRSAVTSTFSFLPVATIEVESEQLNLSGVIQFASVATAAPCPTIRASWNKSTAFPYQQSSPPVPSSNQALNRSSGFPTNGTKTAPFILATSSISFSTSIPSSLVFDHNPATLLSTAIANASIFTGSGSQFGFSDSLVLLLIGVVQMAMA